MPARVSAAMSGTPIVVFCPCISHGAKLWVQQSGWMRDHGLRIFQPRVNSLLFVLVTLCAYSILVPAAIRAAAAMGHGTWPSHITGCHISPFSLAGHPSLPTRSRKESTASPAKMMVTWIKQMILRGAAIRVKPPTGPLVLSFTLVSPR